MFLPPVNKNFMHLKVLLTSLKDVKNVAMHAKMLLDLNAKCSLRNVLLAEEKQKCIDVGMDAHIAKPLDISLLMQTIAQYRKKD